MGGINMIYQKYNKKIDAWVKLEKMPSGQTRIINVKQREPLKPFKGVMKK